MNWKMIMQRCSARALVLQQRPFAWPLETIVYSCPLDLPTGTFPEEGIQPWLKHEDVVSGVD
jgi:hypothetical protein